MISKSLTFGFLSKASLAALVAATGLASASADQLRVLGRPVIGVPDANPVAVSDTIISPGFALDL